MEVRGKASVDVALDGWPKILQIATAGGRCEPTFCSVMQAMLQSSGTGGIRTENGSHPVGGTRNKRQCRPSRANGNRAMIPSKAS
jgi:hypothetical protein